MYPVSNAFVEAVKANTRKYYWTRRIQCAREAGYAQLELNVVAGNERAISMDRDMGFVELGRNPRGFNSRESGFQELMYMLLCL